MGLVVVIGGLGALSLLVFVATRRRVTVNVGRGRLPVSRRRVAMVVAIGAMLVAVSLLFFPVVWWALFPHCCNP